MNHAGGVFASSKGLPQEDPCAQQPIPVQQKNENKLL